MKDLAAIIDARHRLFRGIRDFFSARDYVEVETPLLGKTAPPDPHIEPVRAFVGRRGPFYLHTSPEIAMKKLLAEGLDRIFQITKVFREEEMSDIHNVEFTMLEWYRPGTYADTMAETSDLIRYLSTVFPGENREIFAGDWPVYDLETLFVSKVNINPFVLTRDQFLEQLKARGSWTSDGKDEWNDLFFKVFMEDVEPSIVSESPYFVVGWPRSISTMAKSKKEGTVERFEVYIGGMEIANGYTELVDPVEQVRRFQEDNGQRQTMGMDLFVVDDAFIEALGKLEGEYTGVSVGVDRLLMALLNKQKISDVLPLRFIP